MSEASYGQEAPDDDLADRWQQTAVDQVLVHEAVSATHGGAAPIGVLGV